MNWTRPHTLSLTLFAVLLSGLSFGQATGVPPASGPQAFGSFGGGPFDSVNLGNLNVSFSVPIVHKTGRGLPFNYDLTYANSVWYPVGVSGSQSWASVANWGWQSNWAAPTGYMTHSTFTTYCYDNMGHQTGAQYTYSGFVYHDPLGRTIGFAGATQLYVGSCTGTNFDHFTAAATDGSGYSLSVVSYYTGAITNAQGVITNPPQDIPVGATPSTKTDSNGNQITADNTGVFTDTLGKAALTISGSNPVNFTYTSPTGSVAYKMHYTTATVRTAFGCSGVAEFGPTSESLVSDITLPDNSKYTFTYEPTPGFTGDVTGRIASVTLPTGGTITYTYTGGSHGIQCSDGSTAGLTRTLNPGGTWTYARNYTSTGTKWTTTVTDPTTAPGNQTVITFQEDSATSNPSNNFYETSRLTYQGTTAGTLLRTVIACYNGGSVTTPANCPTTAVASPITRKTVFNYLPDSTGKQAEVDTLYSGSLVTEVDEYDFAVGLGAVGPLTRKTLNSYNTNVGKPAQVQVQDGSGQTVAVTSYGYDNEDRGFIPAPTPTTGTPQHVAVSANQRGNLTSITTQIHSTFDATQFLYRRFTYYDTGTLNTSTGASLSSTTDGPTTTYIYGSGTSCGNSFPTQVNLPLSLSHSISWNCTGGVPLTSTDEDGKTVTKNYTDANYWRPANVVDQKSNQTNINYYTSPLPMATEANLSFNGGSSVSDIRSTVDGFGRPILSQRAQTPSLTNYDSTETDYDVVGRSSRSTMSFQATAGTLNATTPGTTVVYDSLNRPTTVTNGGGGTVSYTYTKNDVLQSVGPTQNFKKQFEYDALGRLTSVCEITTTLPGNGSCGQTVSQTGYWTKYTYDTLNNLTGVTQNAQGAVGSRQIRAFTYDQMSRLTSETNPETGHNGAAGTTNYTYDVACNTYPASAGDLTKRVDNAGNTTCYGYDALHRLKDAGNTGTCRHYRYDAQTPPTGVTISNTLARAAEAYTDNCASTKLTDEWFSYDAAGNLADFYQSTPHSGGYYHSSAAYWPTGALNSLAALNSSSTALFPTIYYGGSTGTGLDGEGRVTKVNAASGTNPLTAATYVTTGTAQPIGALTAVTYGSTDSDSFSFDPNTGRAASYQFAVNSVNDKGTLTWNSNGTLGKLVVADSLATTTDSQTCNYFYDDLARLGGKNTNGYSVDCGTKWQQLFTFDAFGNITKTGSSAFQPVYSTANTNQYSSIPGVTVSYDANGNLLTDNLNTYTWDPNWGNPASINSTNLIYDANGLMVEQQNGSVYTQMLYSQVGKTAIMNGQTLTKAFIGLPGGGTAIYTSSGLAQYRHADWLGSSRLTSTATRTVYSDSAYAPFGEQYAKTGTTDASFTGDNADTTSSLYDFTFREDSSSQGRWMSPDPSGLAAANLGSPQSWNRYAYVLNNPLSNVDPLGLDCVYLSDDGQTVDSIDHSSSSTECGSTGGYWIDGFVPNANYISGIDSENNIIYGYGVINGNLSFSIAGNQSLLDNGMGSTYGTFTQSFYSNVFPADALAALSPPSKGDAAAALAVAINRTGVQAIKNPCVIAAVPVASTAVVALPVAGFSSLAAIDTGLTITGIGAAEGSTAAGVGAGYFPNLLQASQTVGKWIAAGGVLAGKALNAAGQVISSGCNKLGG
jgi:RHS repeat-associated protein